MRRNEAKSNDSLVLTWEDYMQICEAKSCTGCGSCASICPKDCIVMGHDEDGFIVPKVDEVKCVHCKKCISHCPQNKSIQLNRKGEADVYAAYAKDTSLIKKSASGGMFAVLAEHILELQGVVYGAKMNEAFEAVFTRIDSKDELYKLQGSKYIQSYTGKVYRDVKDDLKTGKKVLFSGLPCQIGGLYSFLEEDYPNLYTVDIICYGAPSQKILKEYVSYCEVQNTSKVEKLIFRYKTNKWKPMNYGTKVHMEFANGRQYNKSLRYDPFGMVMMSGLSFAECCYNCHFNGFPRVGDITLGDYLGLGVVEKTDFYCKNGISVVVVNSDKGDRLYKQCNNKFMDEKRALNEVCYINLSLWRSTMKNKDRDDFLKEMRENGIDTALRKFVTNYRNKMILTVKRIIIWSLGERRTLLVMHKRRLARKEYPSKWSQNKYIEQAKNN